MRVSNIVKDYIRSEIEKKYPMENLPEYDDAISRISKIEDEIHSKLDAIVDEARAAFLASNPDIPEHAISIYKPRLRSNFSRRYIHPRGEVYYAHTNWELEKKNNEHLQEIYKKQEDTFNSIVVTLELGGTKADLERMLSEL